MTEKAVRAPGTYRLPSRFAHAKSHIQSPLMSVWLYHTIMDQSHRARMITLRIRPRPEGSVKEHRSIVDAIKRGSPSKAREFAKQHRVRARDQLIPLLEQVGLRHL